MNLGPTDYELCLTILTTWFYCKFCCGFFLQMAYIVVQCRTQIRWSPEVKFYLIYSPTSINFNLLYAVSLPSLYDLGKWSNRFKNCNVAIRPVSNGFFLFFKSSFTFCICTCSLGCKKLKSNHCSVSKFWLRARCKELRKLISRIYNAGYNDWLRSIFQEYIISASALELLQLAWFK